MPEHNNDMMLEYDTKKDVYTDFKDKIAVLVAELLAEKNISIHSIASRLKSKPSFSRKVDTASAKYLTLSDMTDMVGLRVITYFPDEVDKVSTIIESEFDVDYNNSTDKRASLDPDRFGYLSLHYVAKLSPDRLKLSEYKKFSECLFEIQMRSILQHTWAEIEHDLGYKSEQAIPREVRRRFSRLAGLLEIADDEFKAIRDDLVLYQKQVKEKVIDASDTVLIDQDSLQVYSKNNSHISQFNAALSQRLEIMFTHNQLEWGTLSDMLQFVGLRTIFDVDDSLNKLGAYLVDYAVWLLKDRKPEGLHHKINTLNSNISLFYLCFLVSADADSFKETKAFYEHYNISDFDEDFGNYHDGASRLLEQYKVIKTGHAKRK